MTTPKNPLSRVDLKHDELSVCWLCQAGFAFTTAKGEVFVVDPYLTDVVEECFGFKRLMPPPVTPEQLLPDLLLCTHEHLDHMDTGAIPTFAKNERTHFAGPYECVAEFRKLGIAESRIHLLEEGKSVTFGSMTVHPVFADHGELAPDALGLILDFGYVKVYHTGDTAFRPEKLALGPNLRPDLLLPVINGAFGNMNAQEAAELTYLIDPAYVMPTHFGMFREHNGNPQQFLDFCGVHAPRSRALLLRPGEEFLLRRHHNLSAGQQTSQTSQCMG